MFFRSYANVSLAQKSDYLKGNVRIDFSAVEKLCGANREIMLYGFFKILVDSFSHPIDSMMREEGFKVYHYNNPTLGKYQISNYYTGKKACKLILTNLLIHNYEQEKLGKPIIPLVFIIGSEMQNFGSDLDYVRLAAAGFDDAIKEISNSELRRCYKLYSESTGKLKAIAEKTFNFFVLKNNPGNNVPYILEKVPPFWENPKFMPEWEKRNATPGRRSQEMKESTIWRVKIKEFVSVIDQAPILFKPQQTQVPKLHEECLQDAKTQCQLSLDATHPAIHIG